MGMDGSEEDGHAINNGGDDGADSGQGNGAGKGGDGGAGETGDAVACDEYWQRDDRGEWTDELVRAHAVLEMGRKWGVGWAKCVANFFDFESAWGFAEGSWQMGNRNRPSQVAAWLSRRKWTMGPTLGVHLGTRENEELWVGKWWKWWESLQPGERVRSSDGLSQPENVDWSKIAAMYGDNGLMQVIATLQWWGERVEGKRKARIESEWNDWMEAVSDVTWVLEQVLESGEIE
jgi:hypothetical protein